MDDRYQYSRHTPPLKMYKKIRSSVKDLEELLKWERAAECDLDELFLILCKEIKSLKYKLAKFHKDD